MYYLSENEVIEKVKGSRIGLSCREANDRLIKNGKNQLEEVKKQSFLACFFKQFLNIMVAILLLSAVISITIAILNKEYADLFEGFVILFIVVMNAFIGVFEERKAEACLKDLQKYNRINVKVLREGNIEVVDSTELVVGDIIFVEAGNVMTADVRLLETNNFACDESSLTGESVPSDKNSDVVLKEVTPLADRKNMAYSGSLVTNGKAKGIVVATGQDTEIGKIATLLFKTKKEITPLQKSINKIGHFITWTVVVVSLIILSISLIKGDGIMHSIMTAVALAVAAIPESLPAVITIILALGVQQLAKRKCIIKHLHAVETLGSCQIICSDKTGTLTQNKMTVVETYGKNLKNMQVDNDMLKCMINCNNAEKQKDKFVGEPTEKAILEFALSNLKYKKAKIVHEIPFNSSRKMMTVVVNEDGLTSYSKGAPEVLLKHCKFIKVNGQVKELTEMDKQEILSVCNNMSDKALRTLGFAKSENLDSSVEFEKNLVFLGLVGMMDKPRPEVKESIKSCFSAGLTPIMITGDHKRTAFAIAKELGICETKEQVLTGEELDKLSDSELKKVSKNIRVYARVTPEHKVRIVKLYKSLKKIVAMTGDGVNDAPSLKIADIGVGMGKSGTDVVKNVADMVVTDDNFASVVVAVEEGRKIYNNIQKALQFLISTNCVEVFGMLIALMFFPQYTFLLPAQMLFINLVTDSLPAFALGMEKVEPEVMKQPPRDSHSGLFGNNVGKAIIYQSILQTFIAIAVFLIGIYFYSPQVASTMVFFTIIYMQLLHSVNCKTNSSIFKKNLFDNKTFNICFLITLAINLVVTFVPFMYSVFNLEFLNFSQWIMVSVASILIIPTCELFKVILHDEGKNREK